MDVERPSGSVVGGFTVAQPLARGAMGAVYVAEDPGGRRVALKLLSPELAHDERFRQRFLRESRLAASLEHPNVVRTIAAGDDGGVLYLAMQHVDGVDLRELLRAERRLVPERAVSIVAQAAEALDAAHDAGLVHRDVKPGNILVEDERAYVCDFGLARHVSSVGSLTGDRGFVGTVDYVAPEQIRGEPVDGRADVYALGCVLFECLTGARPYERDTELAVVFAHLNEPPPRLTELQPDLPAAWDRVVAGALAKDPAARYPSCGALAAAAREALAGRVARQRARWPIAAAAAAVAFSAAAIGIVLALQNRSSGGASKPAAARPLVLEGLDTATGRALVDFHSGNRFGYDAAPSDVVVTGTSAWLLLPSEQRLLRVDTRTHKLASSLALPWVPLPRLAAGNGFVWAAQDGGPELARVSVADRRLDRVRPNNTPSTGIAAGDGSLWVATDGTIGDVVPENGTSGRQIPYDGSGRLAFGDGALWSLEGLGMIRKLDGRTGRTLARRDLHATVSDIAIGGGRVWAAVVPDGVVYGLDERDLRVRRTVPVGPDPERLSFAGGRLWIANTAAGVVTSFDPRTGKRRRFTLSAKPAAAAYGSGALWAGTVPEAALPRVQGRELRISLPGRYLTLDPAASHSTADEQFETATCANLLGYPDRNGTAGKRLVPEVAAAMPKVTNGGRTYTFRIRHGFRFSPPSNEEMTAATFKHSFERLLSPRLGNGGRGPSDAPAIAGLAAFRAGTAAHISGIAARGRTLSITLVRPVGDLLTRMSLPHLCPVPLSTPTHPLVPDHIVPTSGPYYVSSTAAGRIVLLPNRHYGGQRPRRWARIVYTLGVPTPEAVALVDRGAVDYLPVDYDGDSLLSRGGVLDRRYGPASAVARRGRRRYFPTSG
ncbi:MAG: protein kinase domain-containing protein, partial [Gaiellaceae bacterium]